MEPIMQIQVRINAEGALRNQRYAFTDHDALADLIRRQRSGDPVQTVDSLLQDLRLGNYPLLHGKTFHLTVGVGAAPGHCIQLVDQHGRAQLADARGSHAGS
jgi:hypothetical protein